MADDDISLTADQYLAKANAARAAVFYATWKATERIVVTSVRWLAEAQHRTRMAHTTYRTLHALTDRQLDDIGLSRDEISSVADAVAHNPPASGLTIAELRKARPLTTDSGSAQATWLPGPDERRRKRDLSPHLRAVGAATDSERAVG